MQDKLRQMSFMPAPPSQQSSSSVRSGASSTGDDDPVDLLASYIRQGSLSKAVQLLREPYWKANKINRSIIDRQSPAEINRLDRNDQLLLSAALKAKSHCFYFFCLLLEKGADPQAIGVDGRTVEWDFEEGEEQEDCKVEWNIAVAAKRASEEYRMPPGLDREIELAARQQMHALKLIRNAAVFNSEPSGWIAPAPAPTKRAFSSFSDAPPDVPDVSTVPPPAKRARQYIPTPRAPRSPSPAPYPASDPSPVIPLDSPVFDATKATAENFSSKIENGSRKEKKGRRQRKAHIVLPLEAIPAFIASNSSGGFIAEKMKQEQEERDLALLSQRYSSVPANLVPKRNLHVPKPHRPEIVPIDEKATLELSASGKIYTPQNLKPFACTKEGCDKRFKNANGLKYHRKHGKCSFSGTDGDGNVLGKPWICHDESCGKRYKNKNGLRYHYENSGAHGVEGTKLLANDAHPPPQFDNSSIDDDRSASHESYSE